MSTSGKQPADYTASITAVFSNEFQHHTHTSNTIHNKVKADWVGKESPYQMGMEEVFSRAAAFTLGLVGKYATWKSNTIILRTKGLP